MTMQISFDRYYDVDEMDALLHQLATAYPRLARLDSIGTTWEGRDIWLMTVNDFDRGNPADKPAYWMDGNIHAGEVAGSMAALHAIHRLLTGRDSDDVVSRLLDRMAFYVLPRVNPDGAACYFANPPRELRSGVRPYPYEDEDDGLHDQDVDGDGRILTMRIEDPSGTWKVSDQDPRLMVRRDPLDEGGTYYRLFPEGVIRNFDGHTIRAARPVEGLDFNRNFPSGWEVHAVQRGAGPFPVSEPETRALAQFFDSHRNIVAAQSYHTTGGVVFRPSSLRPDSEFIPEDLAVYTWLGEQSKRITGYRSVSTRHEFESSSRNVLHGGFLDWLYDDFGIFSVSMELWDYPGQAGVVREDKVGALQGWYYDHPVEDDLKILRWLDEQYGGVGFVPWTPFEHPQLGRVEIGGWDGRFLLYNPPPHKLEQELSRANEWCFVHAALAPWLQIRALCSEALGNGLHRVTLAVDNHGWLSTSGSRRARERGAVRPVRAELEGAEVVGTERCIELGHLEGRVAKQKLSASSDTDNRARCEWLVRAAPGTAVTVRVLSERAGNLRATLTLE